MIKLRIKRSLSSSRETYQDTLVTDNPADVVNLFTAKPKPYRISYYSASDVYAVSDAYKVTHGQHYTAFEKLGYGTDVHGSDCTDFAFIDNSTDDMSFEFEPGERSGRTFLTTGYLDVDSDKLKREVPDLYAVLARRKCLLQPSEIAAKMRPVFEQRLAGIENRIKAVQAKLKNLGLDVITDVPLIEASDFERQVYKRNYSAMYSPTDLFRYDTQKYQSFFEYESSLPNYDAVSELLYEYRHLLGDRAVAASELDKLS